MELLFFIILAFTMLSLTVNVWYPGIKGGIPKVDGRTPMPPCKPPRSEKVYRVEIIGPAGRIYYHTCPLGSKPDVLYQDEGKTMKIYLRQ